MGGEGLDAPLPIPCPVWWLGDWRILNRQKRTEDWEQRQLVQWCRKYPWGQLLFHIPNENHHHDTDIGVRAGVPDLFLPIPMHGMHGLFVEMKKADGGRLSESQKRWLGWLGELGYEAVCCHGWLEAKDVIGRYMGVSDGG